MGLYMTFKKSLSAAAVLLSSAFVLAACGGNSKTDSSATTQATTTQAATTQTATTQAAAQKSDAALKDGTYKLVSEADKRGWHVEFTITVENGKITKSDFDNFNEKGERKSANAEYEKAMKDKVGTGPAEFFKAYNEGLVAKQNPSDVEVVAGATNTHTAFVEYANKLIEAAKKGDTSVIKVAAPQS